MQHFISLIVSAAFLVGISPSSQDRENPDARPAQSKAVRLANKKLLARMQGAWRLVDMQLVDQDKVSFGDGHLDHVGYCLISGSYLSVEIHLRLMGKDDEDRGRSFVTGLHRFDLEEDSQMETSTVIATGTDRLGGPEFEAPGTKRHYRIALDGDSMTLARDDGHTLIFERLLDDLKRFDIFGRPVHENPEEPGDEEHGGDRGGDKKNGGNENGSEKKDGGG